jgi:hypothetical protein
MAKDENGDVIAYTGALQQTGSTATGYRSAAFANGTANGNTSFAAVSGALADKQYAVALGCNAKALT